MKIVSFILTFFLISCSEAPEPKAEAPVQAEKPENKTKSHSVLKGHQDVIQRAKDMEKEVLKNAEKKKKLMDDLDD